MLDSIMLGLQFTLIVVGAYQLGLTFFGWYRRKNKAQHAPQKKRSPSWWRLTMRSKLSER